MLQLKVFLDDDSVIYSESRKSTEIDELKQLGQDIMMRAWRDEELQQAFVGSTLRYSITGEGVNIVEYAENYD